MLVWVGEGVFLPRSFWKGCLECFWGLFKMFFWMLGFAFLGDVLFCPYYFGPWPLCCDLASWFWGFDIPICCISSAGFGSFPLAIFGQWVCSPPTELLFIRWGVAFLPPNIRTWRAWHNACRLKGTPFVARPGLGVELDVLPKIDVKALLRGLHPTNKCWTTNSVKIKARRAWEQLMLVFFDGVGCFCLFVEKLNCP